jgi:hypothetical protein
MRQATEGTSNSLEARMRRGTKPPQPDFSNRAALKAQYPDLSDAQIDQWIKNEAMGERGEQPKSTLGQVTGFAGDVLKGLGATALSVPFQLNELIERSGVRWGPGGVPVVDPVVPEKDRLINRPYVQGLITPPPTWGGQIGALAEPILETLVMPEAEALEVPRQLKTGVQVLRETWPSVFKRSAVEAAKMGTQAQLHGEDPKWGAAFGAAGPLVGRFLQATAPAASSSARWLYEKAINPTTKVSKEATRRVVPELLTRDFWAATFPRLQSQADTQLTAAEGKLEEAFDEAIKESKGTYTPTGKYRTVKTPGTPGRGPVIDIYPVREAVPPGGPPRIEQTTGVGRPTGDIGPRVEAETGGTAGKTERIYETRLNRFDLKPVLDQLRSMIKDYSVRGMRPTAQAETAYRQILDQYNRLSQFGRFVTLEDARKLRQILDTPLGEKGAHLIDPKWASLDRVQKRAADALRGQINENFPKLAKANAEYSLWKRTTDLLEQTAQRRVGQTMTPLLHMLATGAGITESLARGSDWGEAVRDVALANASITVLRSPGFQTLSAVQLEQLSRHLLNRDFEKFIRMAGVLLRPKETEKPSPHLR